MLPVNQLGVESFASLAGNQTTRVTGYGLQGFVGGSSTQTGDVWGWNMRQSNVSFSNGDPSVYRRLIFDGGFETGNAQNFSSGAKIGSGNILNGIAIAANTNSTIYLSTSNLHVQEFILTPVPENGLLLGIAALGLILFRARTGQWRL